MTERLKVSASPIGGAPNVLVVNTDPRFGVAVAWYLESRGWQVQHATNVRETLERWDAFDPQLVITDLDGSEMDGFDFLDSLTAFPVRPAVLACALPLASAWLENAPLSALGIDAVLVRPCRLEAIERLLTSMLLTKAATIQDPFPELQ
jgi:DNA-binding response OmpR family regulator